MPHKDPEKRYPRWAWHPTLARDGKFIANEAAEPAGDGWVDTPAALDPAYVPPPEVPDEEQVPDIAPPGYEREHYPTWRYPVSGGDPYYVLDAVADSKLDRKLWKNSPDPTHWEEDHPVAATMPPVLDASAQQQAAPKPALPAKTVAEPPVQQASPAAAAAKAAQPVSQTAEPTEEEAEKIAQKNRDDANALYAEPIAKLLERLEDCTDVAILERVVALELSNPREGGPRTGIVTPIRKKLAALKLDSK